MSFIDCCLETCISCARLQILLYCLLFFFHMYALRMSVVNKEATYLLILKMQQSTRQI